MNKNKSVSIWKHGKRCEGKEREQNSSVSILHGKSIDLEFWEIENHGIRDILIVTSIWRTDKKLGLFNTNPSYYACYVVRVNSILYAVEAGVTSKQVEDVLQLIKVFEQLLCIWKK